MIYDPEYKKTDGFITCSRCGVPIFVGTWSITNGLSNHIASKECLQNIRERKLKELLNKKT